MLGPGQAYTLTPIRRSRSRRRQCIIGLRPRLCGDCAERNILAARSWSEQTPATFWIVGPAQGGARLKHFLSARLVDLPVFPSNLAPPKPCPAIMPVPQERWTPVDLPICRVKRSGMALHSRQGRPATGGVCQPAADPEPCHSLRIAKQPAKSDMRTYGSIDPENRRLAPTVDQRLFSRTRNAG